MAFSSSTFFFFGGITLSRAQKSALSSSAFLRPFINKQRERRQRISLRGMADGATGREDRGRKNDGIDVERARDAKYVLHARIIVTFGKKQTFSKRSLFYL